MTTTQGQRALAVARLVGFVDAKFVEFGFHESFAYRSRMVLTMFFFDADQAGRNPPSAPIRAAKPRPQAIAAG